MDKKIIISKLVDLGLLTAECKTKSAKVTGLSLNADTDLIVYGADDLSEQDILDIVDVHVKPPKVNKKTVFKSKVDASALTPEAKALIKELVDL